MRSSLSSSRMRVLIFCFLCLLVSRSTGFREEKGEGLRRRRRLKHHRCHFSGRPDRLEDYLTATQIVDPQSYYYGRARGQNYFQHLFVDRECTNGLPEGLCYSGLRRAHHCGDDEDWAVIAPDEYDGPGVMWRNENSCVPNEGRDHAANLTVDFLCFDRESQIDLHRCVLDNNPTASTAGLGDDVKEETILKLLATPGNPGEFSHIWDPTECSNGLPPNDVNCLTSLRWGEHCTGDHDWRAIIGKDRKRGVSWFTSHSCTCAHVATDYYCPLEAPSGWSFRRCQFDGHAEEIRDELCERSHFMRAVADSDGELVHGSVDGTELLLRQDTGTCRRHVFKPSECVGGSLPQENSLDCVASFVQTTECGREQDWGIAGADGTSRPLEVRWFNGDMGNCSSTLGARVVIDLLCRDP